VRARGQCGSVEQRPREKALDRDRVGDVDEERADHRREENGDMNARSGP
jgi:hypothetical protein